MAATTGQLGLVTPTQGDLTGTWGNVVNNGITEYTNIAIAGTLSFSGDGAETLLNTTGNASSTNFSTTTAQYAVIRVTGTLTTTKIITGPSYSKLYLVDNAATGNTVTFKAAGQTGIIIAAGESAFVYYNGTDYIKVTSDLILGGYTSTATAAGTTTLTSASTTTQFFTGSTTQTVVLPVAATLVLGTAFSVHNNSTGSLTVNSSGGNLVATVTANTTALFTCILTSGTDAASWDSDFTGFTTALPPNRGGTGVANNAASTLTISGNFPTTLTVAASTSVTLPASGSLGYLNIPQTSQSASYTTVLADSGTAIFHPASDANPRTFTIAANSSVAYALGTVLQFINMSASAVTIAINTDTLTWAQGGSSGSRTLAQYGVANCIKVGTTQWLLTGTNVT
jgi:hypothetical protein